MPADSTRSNPWVAVRPGEDTGALSERVASAYERFVTRPEGGGDDDGVPVRSVVLESWQRSMRRGVDPDRGAEEGAALGSVDLAEYRRAHPISSIRPVVRSLLVEGAEDSGLLVAISDQRGRLLWVEGDRSARERADRMSFVEGSDWSEAAVGTNAPGTALQLDHCVQIFGAEHFSRNVHDWSCAAAPVHDPVSGELLGAVDITGGPRIATPEALQLVRATVAAAEAELRLRRMDGAPDVDGPGLERGARLERSARLEVLAEERPRLRVDGRVVRLSRRHGEILLLLAEHPEGLAAEHLSFLLDERELDTVTVRAEMSRLRKIFGSTNIASRPYRLLVPLITDIDEIREDLDRGDVRAALDRYRGPVLAGSDAPGVVRIREELWASVRAEVLGEADADALRRWTESPHGRDDVESWSAYLAHLDPASPRYRRIAAHLSVLDRRLAT